MTARTSSRLRSADWLSAGLAALAQGGPGALAAEPLARRLGTTKGSFYWHFTDLPAYQAALLEEWEQEARARPLAAIADTEGSVARLRALAQHLACPSEAGAADRAIRAWALSHPDAAAAVARIDAACAMLLRDHLAELGIANPEIARLVQATGIGMAAMEAASPDEAARAMGSLVDLILALR